MAQKKDPAFLFYPQDFITGTLFFSHEDVGLYMRLLCAQHQMGGIIPARNFNSMVPQESVVREKFVETEDGFHNQRLMDEMVRRAKKSNNLSENAKKRWNEAKAMQLHNNNDAIALQLDMPIENENENGNEDVLEVNSNKKSSEKKVEQFPDMAFVQAMELNEMEVERVGVYCKQPFTWPSLADYWKAFSAKFDGSKFYQDRGEIIRYFQNWLKSELSKGKKTIPAGRITVEQMREIQRQKQAS
jgi:uncharacterized protein YdaU (DUF1376 family)